MFYYRIKLTYKGTAYYGWQVQPKEKTVQGTLNDALKELVKSDQIKTLGASRTDRGVHALSQVVKIEIPLPLPCEAVLKGLNSLLPRDIRCIEVDVTSHDFMPLSAKRKEYRYLFTNNKESTPFQNDLIVNFSSDLDIELMKKAASLFAGRHDFLNYYCEGSDIQSTVREIYEARIEGLTNSSPLSNIIPPHYEFIIIGNGFLKQMVRLIMGALISVGRRKVTLADISDSFDRKFSQRLGPTAAPYGLFLMQIDY